jgi:hypothetical protein
MIVFGFVKFRVCFKVLNPNLETPEKPNVSNFQLTCFSAIVDFILWFCRAEKPGQSFELISQLFLFLCSAAKEGFQTQLFKNWVVTQPDFEKPKKKSISNLKKEISSLL